MCEDRLVARGRKRFLVTTDSAHAESVAPNLLARDFAVTAHRPNRVWCGDLTDIPTPEGWLYLAVPLDLATRRVVGWATGATLDTALPLSARCSALSERRPAAGVITRVERTARCSRRMASGRACKAGAESFFSTLKHELLAGADFHPRHEAQRPIFEFIEVWSNRQRRHSTLGYVSPVQYEQQLGQPVVRAA